MHSVCLIPTDLHHGRLGQPARLDRTLNGKSILEHTVSRAARVPGVARIVLIHPANQPAGAMLDLLGGPTRRGEMAVPIETFADENNLSDQWTPMRRSARKWATTGWRGGLGGACVYDELLPANPLVQAMAQSRAQAAVIVGGDWCCFDPALAGRQLERLAEAPESLKLTFSQAPPGLGAMCVTRPVMDELLAHGAGFGDILAYNLHKPTPDPIGKEVCLPVPGTVRGCFERFIDDTPRGWAVIAAVAEQMGDDFGHGDAEQITRAITPVRARLPSRLPGYVSLELTPERQATGPITPGHHVRFDRGPMDTSLALNLVGQLGRGESEESMEDEPSETALLLGGIGDALCHRDWARIVETALEVEVFGVGIETDLLCESQTLDHLLSLPLDVISVRLNADTPGTYQQLMGLDAFERVKENLRILFEKRGAGAKEAGQPGVPWIVPRLAKTTQNVSEMESFFERWMRVAGHALIESPPTGHGHMPDLSPVPMTPPRPLNTPLNDNRLVVLSDGSVTTDDQDWFAQHPLGSASDQTLSELWAKHRTPDQLQTLAA